MNQTRPSVVVLCLLALTACADQSSKTSDTSAPPRASQQSAASSGVVLAIDQLQRQDTGVMGSVGAAAAGGANAAAPTDRVYRVTVRLEDGSTQMLVLESEPGYKIGDRVRYSNGSVQAY